MTIRKLVDALLPSISRSSLLEDCISTAGELEELTLPVYQQTLAAGLFTSSYRPKSHIVNDFEKAFKSKLRSRLSLVEAVAGALDVAVNRLTFLEKAIRSDFINDLNRDGISYPKAMVVQSLTQISFFVRYARHLLIHLYVNETPAVSPDATLSSPFSKAEVAAMTAQFEGFLAVLESLVHTDDKTYLKAMAHIPELAVATSDEEHYQELSVHGTAIEPPETATGFIPYALSPIYRIRMAYAEWQDKRYHAAKAEKQALELRLLHLKAVVQGDNATASMEKSIEMLDRRIGDLNYKIHKMEK